jgi:hypothetical protein
MTEEVDSSMICLIYCKDFFCKCHSVPLAKQLKKYIDMKIINIYIKVF